MKPDTLRPLLPDEVAELRAFAAQEGRAWKQELAFRYWYRGEPVPGFPSLYGLRNSHGPTWLDRVRLAKL